MFTIFNALRWIVRAGAPWSMLPNDFPPWEAVYQQTQRWLAAGCFEAMVHDLRALLRLASGKAAGPTAAIIDCRTLQSRPKSGHRDGYDGAKRNKGSNLHAAVDTLGHSCALAHTFFETWAIEPRSQSFCLRSGTHHWLWRKKRSLSLTTICTRWPTASRRPISVHPRIRACPTCRRSLVGRRRSVRSSSTPLRQ